MAKIYGTPIMAGGAGGANKDLPPLLDNFRAKAKGNISKKGHGEAVNIIDSIESELNGLKLYGKSTQDGTPTPEAPVPIVSTGDNGAVKITISGENIFDPKKLSFSNVEKREDDFFFKGLGRDSVIYFPVNNISTNDKLSLTYTAWTSDGGKARLTSDFYPDIYGGDVENTIVSEKTTKSYSFSPKRDIDFCRIRMVVPYTRYPQDSPLYLSKEIMLVKGSQPKPYSPFVSQKLNINLINNLFGIPVDSGGNYTDADGQQWICDEVDFGMGTHTQRIGKINSYNSETVGNIWMSTTGQLTPGATVLYKLDNPIVSNLDAEMIADYEALTTYAPVTNIMTDSTPAAGIEIEYASTTMNVELSANKMEASRANELAGAVWVYGDHEPESVNDGTKIELTREDVVQGGGERLNSLPSGSKVKLGIYNSKPLKWIVARDSVTQDLRLVLDKESVVDIGPMMYDNAEPSNPDSDIQTKGNNLYRVSNIHQWLNSDKSANNWYSNQHEYDTPPDYGATKDGFLKEWSSSDKDMLMTINWPSPSYDSSTDSVNAKIALLSLPELNIKSHNTGNELDIFDDDESRAIGYEYWARTRNTVTTYYAGCISEEGMSNGGASKLTGIYVRAICAPTPNSFVSGPDNEGYYTIGGEATVKKTVQWNNEANFFARQFTYNSKKQYQTMLEGALASVIVEGAPAQVTDLVVSGSGGTATLTWVNPVDDPVYAETVVVQKVSSAPSDITDGTEIYRGTDQTCTATGLEQSTDYYFAVYTVSGLGVYGQPVVSDVYRYDFPAEPTDYLECAEISETTEFIIPENGYFRIDAIAAGGTGGNAPRTGSGYGAAIASCGGGGRGGNARSEVALQKGTKILVTISSGSVTVKSNGDMEILATPGGTGGNPSSPTNAGAAGTAGGSSGGNIFNESGISGNPGNSVRTSTSSTIVYGGAGATTKVVQINQTRSFNMFGGNGCGVKGFAGSGYNPIMETSGNEARVFISRGNTNQVSPSIVSTLSLTPRNASIEANWTNSGDPESVGTILVSNSDHIPVHPTDGTSVDVAEATSYTVTDLPNNKPSYISLFAYNADKTKYSAAKSDVEIPREVTWYDVQEDLKADIANAQEEADYLTKENLTVANAGIMQVKAYCAATSNPPTADSGVFASGVDEWKAGIEYKLNDLFTYQGNMGYVKQPTLTSLDVYPPFSVGTEALYGARPKPDADGIYPYVYNMGIYEGMLVRDDDGVLYRSITGTQERPTELLYHPKYVPTLLEKVEEGGEEAPSEEYPEWVRPTGAHDAYAQGAKVSHNGKKWTSDIAANVWEPGVYGWTEVIE